MGVHSLLVDSGRTFVYNKVFSANAANYNLHNDLLSNGWNGAAPITVNLTVNTGVYVYSTNVSTAAIDTGIIPANSTISIVNNGYIIGMGGAGGIAVNPDNVVGSNGGPAMYIQANVSLDTSAGFIGGGGGGGGSAGSAGSPYGAAGGGGGMGGGAGGSTYTGLYGYLGGAGGAPGGVGAAGTTTGNASAGGSGGSREMLGSGGGSGYTGVYPPNSSVPGGITHGSGYGAATNSATTYSRAWGGNAAAFSTAGGDGGAEWAGTAGGSGGGWGQAGGRGVMVAPNGTAIGVVTYVAGGAGGKAIALNGNTVTWVNAHTNVYGAVS